MPYITKQFKFCAAHKYWNEDWSEEKNYAIFEDDVKAKKIGFETPYYELEFNFVLEKITK